MNRKSWIPADSFSESSQAGNSAATICQELPILLLRLALFNQRAQSFLRIFQLIEFIQENIHRILQAIAQ